MRILLLSAYDAESHIYWRQGLVEHLDEHEWTVLSLPGRYFSWRIRGNSLSWAFEHRALLEQPYDLLIATSMTDLSALKGFVPNLANTPTLVYFHENQFAYPESEQQFSSVEPKILNLYTALAADWIVFNTDFNRRSFLTGARQLLKRLPDHVPTGLLERLEQRASVIPVPLADDCFINAEQGNNKVLNIVWNHRWEYDKNPQLLLDAVRLLIDAKATFKLHVVGQQFRQIPEAFTQLKAEAAAHIGEWGYMPSRQAYLACLARADVVLSTAIHDFQGIAVLEGVAAGAVPVVPDRLAYQELFPLEYRYVAGQSEAQSLAQQLLGLIQAQAQQRMPSAPDIRALSWSSLAAVYRAQVLEVAASR